jgi:hypothetical protein
VARREFLIRGALGGVLSYGLLRMPGAFAQTGDSWWDEGNYAPLTRERTARSSTSRARR